ncbi:hypothetical protein Acid345_0739 [Candidatus Koribacter versatilis Ellin345]|uniref:Glycosyltransferase RgtA/B/C/D-like domain-containing protein n=1 Tax=Koribacter versatilis (strain Ellin345) TaxID=204669 RepID=Q1ITQ6_KORVE|nr:hypothetical protein [Candidatus Koribacter versatilis]ABF39744.1 hypothetical protein Acid345_0739 [Candidatus Koribacter versatilis Ellin345]
MDAFQEIAALRKLRALQLLALVALFGVIGGVALKTKYCVLDPDIFWHIKVGDWILEHKAVPHTGIFSQTAAQRPWTAYSWGYEILLSRSYAWFGLVGLGSFGVFLTFLVAAALFWAVYRLSGRFWTAWLLTGIGVYAFLFSLMPRPVFFSMAIFTILLCWLLEAQRDGNIRRLYWLPLMFAIWANLHIQFTYGLALLGLFITVQGLQSLAQRLMPGLMERYFAPSTLPLGKLIAIFAGCIAASCIGPYSYHLFLVLREYSKAKFTYGMIIELLPLNFETPSHYFELLLAAAAFVAVGSQKKIDPFKLAFLIIGTVIAFRTTRDAWFICIPAVAFIAECTAASEREPRLKLAETAGVLVGSLFVLFLVARNTDFNQRGLDEAVSGWYPVNAANFLRNNPMPGPLYNSFDWGGFLIWYLPQYPVSVDGRNDLYGDELDALLYGSESGDPNYVNDPYLNAAGVVLLRKEVPLAKLLTVDKRFRVIYQDQLSAIFVRRDAGQ